LDGLKLLLDDKESNLGWRIIAGCLLKEADLKAVLEAADAKPFRECLDRPFQKRVRELVGNLRHVRDDKCPQEELVALFAALEIDSYAIAKSDLHADLQEKGRRLERAIRKIPIKVTTVQSSKGLAADLVFVAPFDDRYFIKDKDSVVSDQDVCNFVVALTRAKKKVVLISSPQRDPTLLGWIDKTRIKRIRVQAGSA
jgi:superfamily I DNA/RNA helicase